LYCDFSTVTAALLGVAYDTPNAKVTMLRDR
jgi:hypothetical protein